MRLSVGTGAKGFRGCFLATVHSVVFKELLERSRLAGKFHDALVDSPAGRSIEGSSFGPQEKRKNDMRTVATATFPQ